ncbi:Protein hedgehog [Mycena venus]|uniref:Protein hedgehog n=1 Tax=Mycena venus TaxID=2733690 RepID=A0A8H7DIE0_9AGAR|nr:Protein hedgehog [Mycena venus]
MSADLLIVVVGPKSTADALALAATAGRADPAAGGHDRPTAHADSTAQPSTTRRIRVVTSYFPATKPQPQTTLPEIERDVQKQMSAMGASPDQVTRILFVTKNEQGGFIDLPFTKDTRFLGLAGRDLFGRFVLVAQACDSAQTQWKDLKDAGIHVAHFDGTKDSARSVVHLPLSVDEPVEPKRGISPSSKTAALAEDGQSNDAIRQYAEAARATGRHPTEAVILLVGQSGHGKSKTINRLLGQNILEVGKLANGSTTKDIQRVKVPVYNRDTGVTITLAFDDTPGGADTSYRDRALNSALIRIYKDRCFPDTKLIDSPPSSHGERRQTYPNIILLVASWDSIKTDAHNPPANFTSPLGQSMYNLSCSGLVDHSRTNVVVVVTKSQTFMHELEDFDTTEEKNTQWMIEAGRRKAIIVDIQRKVFPSLAPWNTVFVENGGRIKTMNAEYPTLPNGELSHQNLFVAIQRIIAADGPHGTPDLTGMHALGVLTGAEPLDPKHQPKKTEILVEASEAVMYSDTSSPKTPPRSPDPPSPPTRIQELTGQYLGATYNPKMGNFGRNCVLSLDPSDIQSISGSGRQQEEFAHIVDAQKEKRAVASRLHCDFEMPEVEGFSAHYASSDAFQSARSTDSQVYTAQHITAEVWVRTLHPKVSQEMLRIINRLPRWSESDDSSKKQYHEFFSNYGTHVVLRLALGGNLRIVTHGLRVEDIKEHDNGRNLSAGGNVPGLDKLEKDVGGDAAHLQRQGDLDSRSRQNFSGRQNVLKITSNSAQVTRLHTVGPRPKLASSGSKRWKSIRPFVQTTIPRNIGGYIH